ncbi:cation:proton antiporter [Oceanithermus sp.]
MAEAAERSLTAHLFEIFMLILATQIMGWLFQKMKQPAVIGELLAGVIVGPALLGWVVEGNLLEFISELGAIFLLFMVGLETRLEDILKVGKEAFIVAVVGAIIPFFGGYYYGLYIGFSQVSALFLGAALVATSVGITARVMQELEVLSRPYSRIILGAAVIDDIEGLIVLAIVSGIANTGSIETGGIIKLVLISFAFVGGAMALVPFVRRIPLDKLPFQSPLGVSIAFGLAMATLASFIGLAPIVGAFMAGMVMAELREEYGLEEPIHAIESFLAPIFFAYMGVQLDLAALGSRSVLIAGGAVSLIAIVGKLFAMFGALTQGLKNAIVVGVGMVPRGEVGLIVASIGLGAGAVDEREFAIVIFMVVVTTIVAPLSLRPLIAWADPEVAASREST